MSDTPKPFARKYTDEQIAAVVYAMLDHQPHLSGKKAVKAAAAGRLPGAGATLEPFGAETRPDGTIRPISEQTAYSWKKREREARGVRAQGRLAKVAGGAEAAMRVVLADAWTELERAHAASVRAALSPSQRMRAVTEYVKAARVLKQAEDELTPAPSKRNGKQPSTEKPKRNTEADNLARAARKRAETEHHETPTPQGAAPQHNSATQQDDTHNASDSGARGHGTTGIELAGHSANQLAHERASGPENGSTARS